MSLQSDLLAAMNSVSDIDNKTPQELRSELATKQAIAIKAWITQLLSTSPNIPQDGGAAFKASILSKIPNS